MKHSVYHDFSTLLKNVHLLYGKPLPADLADLYWDIYRHYDYAAMKHAYGQAVLTAKFIPTPAQIVGLISSAKQDKIAQTRTEQQCCRVIGANGFCGRRDELVRVNPNKTPAEFMCREHYEQRCQRQGPAAEVARREATIRKLCLEFDVHPQDFYVRFCDYLRKHLGNVPLGGSLQRGTSRLTEQDYAKRVTDAVNSFIKAHGPTKPPGSEIA